MQNDFLNTIHSEFDRCACEFAKKTSGVCNITSDYKGDEIPKNLETRYAKISYDSMIIEFRYTAHGTMGLVNSILECMICTDKTEDAVAIPLQFVCEYFNKTQGIPLSVPLISNKEGMSEAFDCLSKVIDIVFDDVCDVSQSTYQSEKLCDFFGDELYRIYGIERPEDIIVTDSDYSFLRLHFVSDYYLNYFRNDKKSAVKSLEKLKKKSNYDNSVLSLWKDGFSFSALQIPALRKSAETYNKSGVQKNSSKEFFAMLFLWVTMTPVISIPYCALFFLLLNIEGRDSVYLMGAAYNLPYCFLAAFITAIAASYFLRKPAMKLLFKKDYERYCEMDSLANGAGADKFMSVFLWIIIFASLIGCVLYPKQNINFKEVGFIDNRKLFAVDGEYHDYSDIKKVYYIGQRTNGFGDTLEYPSYVIELTDGTEIDLYDYDEIEKYEDTLLSHLKDKGVKIEKNKRSGN